MNQSIVLMQSFISDKLKKHEQFIRFLWVGGINTIVGYSTFALSLFVGFHYTIAVLIATCIGLLFNFFSTGSIVFKKRSKRFFLPFIMVNLTIYGCTVVMIKLLSFFCSHYVAGGISSVTMPFVGYFLNKKFVFK